MRRALALVLLAACSSPPSPSSSDDSPPPAPTSDPTKPVTTLGARAAEMPSPGLCAAWSAAPVDLSPLAAEQISWVTVRGTAEGMSMLASGGALDGVRVAKDGSVNAVELPEEKNAQPMNAVATPDGGWLVAWSTGDGYSAGQLYFVRYDAAGNPVARTGDQPDFVGAVILGPQPNGDVDVAWDDGASMVLSTLPASSPTSFPSGKAFAAYDDVPEIFSGGRLFGAGKDAPDHLRAWDRSGAVVLEVPLAFGPAQAVTPGVDGASAVRALGDEVVFEDPSAATVVPVDVALDGAIVASRAGAVVGTLESAEADDGGTLAAVVFEVTKAGLRSPLATAPLGASPYLLGSNGAEVQIAASDDGQTYFVLFTSISSYQPPLSAVFTCTRRS